MESQKIHPLGPFDITLLAKDGKEFKAHRRVLSEASPFFEKLLESDMKENREGVVRLEKLTEFLLKEILSFIYTGDVQILSEESSKELIMAGEYLFLPELKAIAGIFLERSMTTSNCISTYYFAETYRCQELAARAKTFIQSNFVIVAKSVEFLNLTSHEVEEWISCDEIVINAEEDVFKIILGWIAKEREMRKGKFEELFRHVRLIFARGESVACYIPDEDKWYQLPEAKYHQKVTSCDGKLYAISDDLSGAERCEPLCNNWVSLEWADGSTMLELDKYLDSYMLFEYGVSSILWANGEMFAVLNDAARFDTVSNTWEKIAAMQEERSYAFGTAANEKIYIAGGLRTGSSKLKSCEVYNEMTNEWCFIASLTVPRVDGSMVCVDGTLYVLGGTTYRDKHPVECYDYEKDKWRVKTTLSSSKSDKEYKACSARLFKAVITGKRQACSEEDKACSERVFTGKRQVKKCCSIT
ncbi:hypothetical protein ACROYT_G016241 [Oculina patagonica]